MEYTAAAAALPHRDAQPPPSLPLSSMQRPCCQKYDYCYYFETHPHLFSLSPQFYILFLLFTPIAIATFHNFFIFHHPLVSESTVVFATPKDELEGNEREQK